nr:hypothetical protein [Tanacetum cinerariifolium]
MKARSMLLMALPSDNLMTFNQYKDAKTLFAAIQIRFGGNEATKKTQNTLLKQMYKNFSVPSTNSLDFIFNRLQKIRNKPDLDTMSFDDLYNNFKIAKQEFKNFETLKTQLDDLRIEFNKSNFNLATYKRGLASVEEQLVFYKKSEVIFCEQLVVLKRDISYKDSEISMLKSELEKLKQEKESNQLKIEKFDNAFMSLDKLIGSQIPDQSRKGVGFVCNNVVLPPHTWLFLPPKLDLSNSSLEEFQQHEFEGYGPKTSKSVSEDISNKVRESPDPPLVKELVSDDKCGT